MIGVILQCLNLSKHIKITRWKKKHFLNCSLSDVHTHGEWHTLCLPYIFHVWLLVNFSSFPCWKHSELDMQTLCEFYSIQQCFVRRHQTVVFPHESMISPHIFSKLAAVRGRQQHAILNHPDSEPGLDTLKQTGSYEAPFCKVQISCSISI